MRLDRMVHRLWIETPLATVPTQVGGVDLMDIPPHPLVWYNEEADRRRSEINENPEGWRVKPHRLSATGSDRPLPRARLARLHVKVHLPASRVSDSKNPHGFD
jgi:hypothetical protein